MLPYAGAVAAPRLSVLSIFVDAVASGRYLKQVKLKAFSKASKALGIFVDAVASGRYETLSFTCFTSKV